MTNTIAPNTGTGGSSGSQHDAGAELLRDIQSTASAFDKGDWLSGGLGVAKVAMDVLDVTGDPLGAISSAGIGWVLGAVSFLREPFNILQGNSGAISSSAQSWGSSGGSLTGTAGQYRQACTNETRSWTGDAGNGYRAASTNQANGIEALGQANQAIAGAMQQGGQAVAQARKTVMDLISDAVQKIIQICLDALSKSWLSFGASIALGIARSVQQAVQTAQKLAQQIQSLIQTLQKIVQVVQQVVKIAQDVKQLLDMIGGKASAPAPVTTQGQQIHANGAMATNTDPNAIGIPVAPQREISQGYQHTDPAMATGPAQTTSNTQTIAPGHNPTPVDPAHNPATGPAVTTRPSSGGSVAAPPTPAGTVGVTTPAGATATAGTGGSVAATPMPAGTGTGASGGATPVTSGRPVTPTRAPSGGGVQYAQSQAPTGQPSQAAPAAGQSGNTPAPPPGVPSWGPTGPPPDGGQAASRAQVDTWIETARQILIQQGVDPSLMNSDQMAALIQHESSNNPHAINLWDSNATAGHPSKGLMQTIDSTFSEHHLPGHDDIWAPVDNIIAGTRYAIDRYGSISDVPGVRALAGGSDYVGY